MKKFGMLNCWDDLNKGDLGIMLATVNEFKKQDPDCEIIEISSFNMSDESYKNSHVILRRYVPIIYPAIFGTLGLRIRGKYIKSIPAKLLAYYFETIRYVLCLLTPNKIATFFLTSDEKITMNAIKECDAVFSKGGSVFTDYNSKRGAIALKRICRFYRLLHKFNVPYYILGQSFGPIANMKGIRETNRVIDDAEKVFIRERACVSEYPLLHLDTDKTVFSNDAGFMIEPSPVEDFVINNNKTNVGMTIRGEVMTVFI